MLIVHDPRCAEYGSSMRPEQPARVVGTAERLRRGHPSWQWKEKVEEAPDEPILRVHTAAHLRRLDLPVDFDGDTPALPQIAAHARRSVQAALEVAEHALHRHTPAFSLMRPPGHHATADRAMGFCYLNQVAIAALAAQRQWDARRVAVWDFDAHHGNGTEEIFQGRVGLLYASVHQYPGYPGTGTADRGPARNWPVPPNCPAAEHMKALRASWEAITGFHPDLVLVSAGFDAYREDPITAMCLDKGDFAELGQWLRHSPAPVAALLEGGYSAELPELVDSFLSGWE
jgi:acetoin utilization deacetylase AcuC-like enzyme